MNQNRKSSILQTSNTNQKASQGGLTPPTLYAARARFFESRSQNTEGWTLANQLPKCHTWLVNSDNYITSESVAYLSHLTFCRLSTVVIISQPNQLPKCHVAKMSRQYGKNVFTESLLKCHVADLSRQCGNYVFCESLQKYHSCKNVTSSGKNITLQKCDTCVISATDPPQWKMTPAVENDPRSGK